MSEVSMGLYWWQGLGIAIACAIIWCPNRAVAQIIPDNTLPNNSSVTFNGKTTIIAGGTTRGANLFHSLREFSIPRGSEALFNNVQDIQNILTRVTGGAISNIDGLIRANGKANLFVINPSGIVFGSNARLDIGGSFVASTANSLKFADGFEFSATNLQTTPLLTISVPTGLQMGVNPGKITVQGDGTGLRSTVDLIDTNAGLRVPSNQTLALVGGEINLEGATIKTAGGRIELGSVSGEGLVSLNPTDKGFSLGYGGVQNFGNIQLTQQASVDASGTGAGDVRLTGKRVTLSDGSAIEASTLGANNGGGLVVNATESVELNNSSTLAAQVYPGATGNGGNLTISTKDLLVRDGSQVSSGISGTGHGGNLTVNASNSVQVVGRSADGRVVSALSASAYPGSTGDAGDLTITTKDLLVDGAQVDAGTFGAGKGGNLTINTQNLLVRNGAGIFTSTYGKGNGGILTVNASGGVQFIGSGLNSSAQSDATGNAGDITVNAQTINLSNQGYIISSILGQGRGGKITLKADDIISLSGGSAITSNSGASGFGKVNSQSSGDIEIRGRKLSIDGENTFISSTNLDEGKAGSIRIFADDSISLNGFASISASSSGKGDGGNIELQTRSLTLSNGGNIGTQALGSGNSGDLLVNASDSVSLSGIITLINPKTGERFNTGSNLGTSAFGTGNSGQLTINTQRLSVNDGGDIITSTELGRGGDLTINAKDSVEVVGGSPNASSQISTGTFGPGDAGSLNILASRFSIRDGGIVTTSTSGTGKGGNLTIDAKDSVEVVGRSPSSPNSLTIISTSTLGSGDAGSMKINTGRFSIRDGARVNTSTFGQGNGGKLTVNADLNVELIGSSTDGRFFSSLASSAEFGSTGNAGSLTITSQDLIVRDGAQVSTATSGAGKGGNLTINNSNKVQLIGRSFDGRFFSGVGASTNQGSTGDAGSLTITSQDLIVRDGAQVTTATSGAGKGGNLSVNAANSVQVIGTSVDGRFFSGLGASTDQGSTGDAGSLTIKTQDLLIRDGARVTTATFGAGKGGNLTVNASGTVEVIGASTNGSTSKLSTSANQGLTGNAGDLTINTQNLLVRDGGQVDAATFGQGKGGNLTVNASNRIQLIGTTANGNFPSGLFASAEVGSAGNAGELMITTPDLLVRNGATVTTATSGAGKGGNLNINAANSVQLTGTSVDGRFVSTLSSSTNQGSTGNAGDLTIKTQDLLVQDGAQVGASTLSEGNAGNLTVNASRSVQVIGRSVDSPFITGLGAAANLNSTGNAGDLTINTPQLIVRDGARVSVTNIGTGNAGVMTINANTIRLDNQASLNANTRSPNKDPNKEQATINLNSQNLILRRNSNITTNATGKDVIGGNINIKTNFLAAFENSDISANSTDFRGGNVTINAQGIFGIQFRDVASPQTNDITATGASRELGGNVEITTPDIDPTSGLVELPINLDDASRQISTACTPGTRQFQNTFVATGRGGLPINPTEPLQDSSTVSTWVRLRPRPENLAKTTISPQPTAVSNTTTVAATTQIVPATGWVVDTNGNIKLVAQDMSVTTRSPWQTSASCPVSQ